MIRTDFQLLVGRISLGDNDPKTGLAFPQSTEGYQETAYFDNIPNSVTIFFDIGPMGLRTEFYRRFVRSFVIHNDVEDIEKAMSLIEDIITGRKSLDDLDGKDMTLDIGRIDPAL